MNKIIRPFTRRLPVLLLAALFALPLLAQNAAQNPVALKGQVTDVTGAVIPGAQISLMDADGKEISAVADARGEFTVTSATAGLYTLSISFTGFQPYVQAEVKLPAATPLKIALAIANVAIETTVSANDQGVSSEPDQNMSATVLEEEFIQTLPDNEDDMRAFLQGLAGTGGGGASGGQGGAQIFVDGFSGGRLPPRESIMQIRVNQNPFTAEYSAPGMGRIDIVTKPGNDKWRGTFGLNVRNSVLDARNAFALSKPDLSQTRYQFNFGGPLLRKKLSFFFNAERRGLEGSNTVRAQTLDGAYVANVAAPNTSSYIGLRADYLLNQKNTISLGYNRVGSDATNREFGARFGGGFGGGPGGGFGGGGFGGGSTGASYLLPERGSNAANGNHSLQLSMTSLLSSRLILESRLRYQREASDLTANTNGVAINVLDAFNGGGATCCPNTSREHNLEWQEYLTWNYGRHTLKGGVQLQYNSTHDMNANNFNGTYTFSSLDQYRAVLNGERVNPADPASALVRPTQFTINRGNPELAYSQVQAALFVQDDWRLRRNFTLSLGLRQEFQSQLGDKSNFAPRIGIAWSPFKDGKTMLRLGGGIFYSRLSSNLYANTLRYNGATQESIIIRNPLYPDPFAGDPLVSVGQTLRRVLDPALRAPYTINFSASVERQLPRGWVTTATYLYTRGVHQFRARNINAPLADTGARPDVTQGNIYQIESSARSLYQGLMLSVQRRFGSRFQLFSNYTLSRTQSDADSAMSVPANNYDLRSEWGPAFTDRRHVLFVGGNVTLPYGFRLAPFVTASSGSPYNLTTGLDDNRDTEINDRPAGIGRNTGLPASLYSLLSNRCISGCFGATPVLLRDYLTTNFPNGVSAVGPGSFNVSMNVSRTLSFGKRETSGGGPDGGMGGGPRGGGMGGGPRGGMGGGMFGGGNESGRFNVTLSAQISNLLNRVNYGQYSGVLSSPFLGRANSASGARQLELGLRFSF
ncbi:MAG: TonB-dependent receptor domain-containing protein [Blastocatellia bacterium]